MKNRSKMILGLASMLGISAGATAVSGFAWFTTQRTATINSSQYKVGAAEGSLELAAVAAADKHCTSSVTGAVATINAEAGTLADVSSKDGSTFYKAVLTPDGGAVDHLELENKADATSKVNTSQFVYVSWSLKVKNTAEGNKINVYLSNVGSIFNSLATENTTDSFTVATSSQTIFNLASPAKEISSVTVDGVAAAYTNNLATGTVTLNTPAAQSSVVAITYKADYSSYYRLAIINDTDSENKPVVFRYTNSNHLSYLVEGDTTFDGTKTLTVGDNADAAPNFYTETEATVTQITSNANADNKTTVNAGNQLLIKDLQKDSDQTLKFVVWCEGTATPEAAVNSTNLVGLSFSLIGLTPVAA